MKMGKLIALEGPDTSGKTTTINKIKAALPIIFDNEKFIFTREPGDLISENTYNESELIRCELLTNEKLTALEQAQLFAQARFAHTKAIIKELKKGNNVITDRYLLSSLVYQGLEIGIDEVIELNKNTLNLLIDEEIEIYNIVLYLNKSVYNDRISQKEKDAMELVSEEIIDARLDFHASRSFLEQLNVGKIYHVDANQSVDYTVTQTLKNIFEILEDN